MTRAEKDIEDLARRIQDVLWELDGDQDVAGGSTEGAATSGSSLTASLQKIQRIESTKLRISEAQLAAKRLQQPLPNHIQQVLSLIYAEVSAAEFAAKGAMQARQFDLIGKLIDDGYEQARSKAYDPLEDTLRQLRSLAAAHHPHSR